ncbi:3-methyl-2-oxobutanoate hydroxymethyltransferase [Methylocella sp.]|uniref:3-methyl-2-oxobutanoate hydroxymethyltransferase n=1 Tax=Methylocella sp. TaxID=1978226 RepID=UPI003783EA19
MSVSARFFDMKRAGAPIAVLTAYDAPTARLEAEAGVDVLLVGDSVGVNVLGYASEREVSLADMVHHVGAVRRGAPRSVVIGDLPFRTYETPAEALASARALVAAGADIVKFEGARPDVAGTLRGEGIETCGHLGLEPQTHLAPRVKGRAAPDALKLLEDARALDDAGVSLLVLEMIPQEVAREVTRAICAPTIGIGAGGGTDGQVLVVTDLLGVGEREFRHNRRYQRFGPLALDAFRAYVHDVGRRDFPCEENAAHMAPEELEAFLAQARGLSRAAP